MPKPVRAVVFDVGEVLVSEARIWARWGEHLGVAPFVFFAALGAVIERGGHHRDVFSEFAPGFDPESAMGDDPTLGSFDGDDLYPDVRPCLAALRDLGLVLGVAGNQPARASAAIQAMDLPLDFVATSEEWAVEKPQPGFFAHVAAEAGARPEETIYVGDRLDNDVLPAAAAGMVAAFLRRGPWGHVHARRPEASRADLRLDSLAELPALIAGPEFRTAR